MSEVVWPVELARFPAPPTCVPRKVFAALAMQTLLSIGRLTLEGYRVSYPTAAKRLACGKRCVDGDEEFSSQKVRWYSCGAVVVGWVNYGWSGAKV